MISPPKLQTARPSGFRFLPRRALPTAPGCAWVRTRATVVGPAPVVKGLVDETAGVAVRVWLVGTRAIRVGPFWERAGDAEEPSEAGAAWIGERLDLNVGDAVLRLPLADVRLAARHATPPLFDLEPLEPPLRPPLDRLVAEADEQRGRLSFCERVIEIGDRFTFHGVVEAVAPSTHSGYRGAAKPGERFVVRPDLGPVTLRLARRRERA